VGSTWVVFIIKQSMAEQFNGHCEQKSAGAECHHASSHFLRRQACDSDNRSRWQARCRQQTPKQGPQNRLCIVQVKEHVFIYHFRISHRVQAAAFAFVDGGRPFILNMLIIKKGELCLVVCSA
jgi:hypothetical protein